MQHTPRIDDRTILSLLDGQVQRSEKRTDVEEMVLRFGGDEGAQYDTLECLQNVLNEFEWGGHAQPKATTVATCPQGHVDTMLTRSMVTSKPTRNLQQRLDVEYSSCITEPHRCRTCNEECEVSINRRPAPCLFVSVNRLEVDETNTETADRILFNKDKPKHLKRPPRTKVNNDKQETPNSVIVAGTEYSLRAIVTWNGDDLNGHVIPYRFHESSWYCLDDNATDVLQVKKASIPSQKC
jgi:hypothetical protein